MESSTGVMTRILSLSEGFDEKSREQLYALRVGLQERSETDFAEHRVLLQRSEDAAPLCAEEVLAGGRETDHEPDGRHNPSAAAEDGVSGPELVERVNPSVIEERVVMLGEDARLRRGALLKEAPSLTQMDSPDQLKKYTVDALRKMAKQEGLDLGRAPTRERVLHDLGMLLVGRNQVCSKA